MAKRIIFTGKKKAMEKQMLWQGKPVNYSVEGTGFPVVLLHGFLENIHIWDDFREFLKPDFQVVAIDLPGFGKTAVLGESHPMPLMAEVVKGVLENEKIQKTVLIGHSMGGYVSLAFASRFPEMLAGLVLFHSHAAADNEEGKQNRNRTIEVVRKDHKNFITGFIPLLFAEENVSRFSKEIAHLREMSLQTPAQGVIAALAGMRDRADYLAWLRQAPFPLFFVVGKQDSRIPIEKIVPQVTLPPHAETVILDKVGHMGFVEAPSRIFPVVRDFLKRCETRQER
jgi:pimeloyl-ACP methyl ester carboxylesterase